MIIENIDMSTYQKNLVKIKKLLKTNNAKIVAHYYVDETIQKITEDTDGCVSDSLEMARYGKEQDVKTLIVAGVRFMGETAKILNPEKKILMLDMDASCSLDMSCNHNEFEKFCKQYPDREDIAETINWWIAVRCKVDRISKSNYKKIIEAIPNRLKYLDEKNYDTYPLVCKK